MKIKISEELREKCPQVAIGCIEACISVGDGNSELWEIIDDKCKYIEQNISSKDISKIENIEASRKAYRALGKDPTRYRLSSEALVRRIVKGNGLYKVNNIVDINNLISLESYCSVGTYDLDKVEGEMYFTIGDEGASYDGIGKGSINIEYLPIFKDSLGAFGSTTSDSTRAMITNETKHIRLNIISFNGDKELNSYINYGVDLLKKYADATEICTKIVY